MVEPPPADPDRAGGVFGWMGSTVGPWVELVVVVGLAFAAAYLVQWFVVKPYRIPSESMENTLLVGDRVLVSRFWFRFADPERGEVIVFHPPGHGDVAQRGATTEASVTYIKRVIGLPGETLTIAHGIVSVCKPAGQNCRSLRESYTEGATGAPSYGPYTVPKNDYFVMGDNRDNSDDSRVIGTIPRSWILGRAFVTYWPLTRIGSLL
jgi:signal peptidase I